MTSDIFSDKTVYPAFFRTVPSDSKQINGMVGLMTRFKWNWIAVVVSDDEYGTTALQQFSSSAMGTGICVAYEGLISNTLSNSETNTIIEDILDKIAQADVNVVLVFASLTQSIALFEKVIMRNMTKVWIGSASWVLSEDILSVPGIERIGTVIGFFPNAHYVFGFEGFLKNVISQIYPSQSALVSSSLGTSERYQNIDLQPDIINSILSPLTALYAHSVYTAVYAVAYALHSLLNCTFIKCNTQGSNLYAWKVRSRFY